MGGRILNLAGMKRRLKLGILEANHAPTHVPLPPLSTFRRISIPVGASAVTRLRGEQASTAATRIHASTPRTIEP